MTYLFTSTIINAVVMYYLITKTDKLQKQIDELKRKSDSIYECFKTNNKTSKQ